MFKRLISLCIIIVMLPFSRVATFAQEQEPDITVKLYPNKASTFNNGEFQGWGTSLCWWANYLGQYDELAQKSAKLMFNPEEGLGLNIVRYNIGGGDDPTHNHITRPDSNMPGFLNPDGSYDWTADANQRLVLDYAIKEGVDIVEAFSNSPPYFMTNSGCSTGAVNAIENNLKDDQYDEFANYLAEVAKHFKDSWGVTFDSIEPMNEPASDIWGAFSVKQEGCHFDQGDSQSRIITALGKAMQDKRITDINISAADETSVNAAISGYNSLSNEAKALVSRINTHTYDGTQHTELKELAKANNKNLWMSEVDGGNSVGGNSGQMGPALWLGQKITEDMNKMQPSAWILWQVIDRHISDETPDTTPPSDGGYWGTAIANHYTQDIELTKKYYAFGQYTKYIRPGYTIIESGDNTVAAYDKKTGKIVIVAVNANGKDKSCRFDLSDFANVGSSVQVIRTSGDLETGENWAKLSDIKTNDKCFTANLLANSITTFVIAPDSEVNSETLYMVLKNKNIVFTNTETQMEVETLTKNDTSSDVIWTVTEPDGTATDKATINANGVLTAIKSGRISVKVTDKNNPAVFNSIEIFIIDKSDYIAFSNKNSGLFLNIHNNNTTDGSALIQSSKEKSGSAQWKLNAVNGTDNCFNILNRKSNLCVSVVNDTIVTTSKISLDDHASQWIIEEVTTGYYTIINKATKKHLSVHNMSKADGGYIVPDTIADGENSLWKILTDMTESTDSQYDLPMMSITEIPDVVNDSEIVLNGEYTESLMHLTINGTDVSFGAWNNFTYKLSLTEGINNITITAEDINGNIIENAFSVEYVKTTDSPCNTNGVTYSSKTDSSIIIDGKLDEDIWKINNKATKVVSGNNNNQCNNIVNFGTVWDDKYLYIACDVTDDKIVIEDPQQYNNDCVEVFINGDGKKSGAYNSTDKQLFVGFNKSRDTFYQNGNGVITAWCDTDKGYQTEMAIPWSLIGINPADNVSIGFDILVDDNDTTGTRESIAGWNGEANNWQTTASFGSIILSDNNNDQIKVVVNDDEIVFDVMPYIENTTIMIPLRAVMERLGSAVDWINESETVIIDMDKKTIRLSADSTQMYINNDIIPMDFAPVLKNNRVIIPLSFFEQIELNTSYNKSTNTVTINK